MASKHRLRRSCAFCRARKIKCSNETICEACRKQGADCIYDFEPPRPKARPSMDGNGRAESLNSSPLMNRQRSATESSSTKGSPGPMGPMTEEPFLTDDMEDVATVLDRTFFENFASHVKHTQRHPPRSQPDGMVSQFGHGQAKYSSILSLLSHDLVGLSTAQLGSLGCAHLEDRGAGFFLSGLEHDTTQTMFDNIAPATNPVTEYGQRQQTQLIDVWYSSHPLSFLVSKTLLLRELRDGTHDEILLAVMLADANFTIGSETANARGHSLLQYATSQLRRRPLQTTKNSGVATDSGTVVYSGISTRIFSNISTVQALMLLGWNAMGSGHFRRAISYIQLAGSLSTDLKEQVTSTDGMQLSSRINGIDVYDVEKELVDYLYWTTYSLIIWVYMQTGRGHFSASPTVLTPIFIPQTEESSSSIQLDLVSENVNTLQKQKTCIREMWALAHGTISVAHGCGFHPLQQRNSAMSPPVQRCRETNRFLMESIHELNKQGNDITSASFVSIVYHTLAIQLLFPAQADDFIVTDVVDRLCYSIEEILQIFAHVSRLPQDSLASATSMRSSLPEVFGLALDTCSRALHMINTKRATGALMHAFSSVQVYGPTLEAMASRLYNMSKDDFLDQRSSVRAIRKQLKASKRAFGPHPSSGSSHSSSASDGVPMSPGQGSSSLSPESSHSTVDTPEMEPHPTFISPRETTTLKSPESVVDPMFNQANMVKPQWRPNAVPVSNTAAPNELMYNPMDPNALGIQSREDLSLSGLVDLQHAWLPQMPPLMEVDMAAVQWDWSSQDMKGDNVVQNPAIWSDMDMVL